MKSTKTENTAINVLFVAAESAPWMKVGGLGDVIGSLPLALQDLGESVAVMLPRYGNLDPEAMGWQCYWSASNASDAALQGAELLLQQGVSAIWQVNNGVPVYFLDFPHTFGAWPGPYQASDFEAERAAYCAFCFAVLPAISLLGIRVETLHLHDWHTALLAKLLPEAREAGDPNTLPKQSILTIHNVGYQGPAWPENILAQGIRHADWITAVSPRYAAEIQTPEGGAGLDGLLRSRQDKLIGIVNGIDTELINPATDMFLARRYDNNTYLEGKAACKQALCAETGLPYRPEIPLMGMVSRLVDQKGIDLLIGALSMWESQPIPSAQWVILGTGDPYFEAALRELAARHPESIAFYGGFHLALAQQIYAGSDVFLMPSRYEPCGLSQLMAMRYGSLPLVRATGGLCDTVVDWGQSPEKATGFWFAEPSPSALLYAMQQVTSCYDRQQPAWQQAVARAMAQDFSWRHSARAYQRLYRGVI